MTGELINHLWQTTAFAVAAGLVAAALRKNRAQVRYGLWLSASLKFLVPFSLLMSLGGHMGWAHAAKNMATQGMSFTMVQIAQPFPDSLSFAPSASRATNWFPFAILGVWSCGFALIAVIRIKDWLHIRAVVRSSTPLEIPHLEIPAGIEVRSSPGFLEPGVVGLWRPALLLPAGITEHLTPPQLNAVLTHEMCHVRRRDNLTSAIHMIVEAVFWFHPFVWWIGARLVEERERACDEEVLRLGGEPEIYAESILRVCKFYVESPLTCVSGVTGSDLKKRVERIMRNHVGETLNGWRKLFLATVGVMALAAPFVVGALTSPRLLAQSAAQDWQTAAGGKMAFDVTSVKANKSADRSTSNVPLTPDDTYAPTGGLFSATHSTLMAYMRFAYKDMKLVYQQTPDLAGSPAWIRSDPYDIQAKVQGNPTKDQMRLMVQSLLADRFKLAVHRETRQTPIYALVVSKSGKTGPQLKPDDGSCSTTQADVQALNAVPRIPAPATSPEPTSQTPKIPCGILMPAPASAPGRLRIAGRKVTIALLAKMATNPASGVDRPIFDQTGLNGTFDISIEWAPRLSGAAPGGFTPDPDGPTFTEALQDQLGLKLEPQTGPIDVLVIDHAEEPSPN